MSPALAGGYTSEAGGVGFIPGWGTKIPHAAAETWCSQINKQFFKKIKRNQRKGNLIL